MTSEDWGRLKYLLENQSQIPELLAEVNDPHAHRFLAAIVRGPGSYLLGDIAGLLRTVLGSRSASVGAPAKLNIPSSRWLPSVQILEAHGIGAAQSQEGSLVAARRWAPRWLDGIPEQRVYQQPANRYASLTVATDPVAKDICGFDAYRSPGQAAAVRAATNLDPGGRLLINLPTSAGKSLAFEICFAEAARRNEASVLIVPTTTLALDHERRLRALGIDSAVAYHSGLSSERREQIRKSFGDGTTNVLIASPESVLTGLTWSIRSIAQRGRLAFMTIDEAHMVSGWGIEFRPEFQLLGGFIGQLIDLAPTPSSRVRTLLLSATITEVTRNDLRAVFGDFAEVAAVSIRPEPEYWISNCESKQVKFNRVIEAVRHLPRPLIIYTSLREEARELCELVRSECQIGRMALIRGGDVGASINDESVISRWANGTIDVVVGTSAFGLGIDNSHVRTVIHACLPEHADRFYQEVGRGGRDGRNSISLLLHTSHGDLIAARRLSRKRLITPNKAWPRWRAMAITKRLRSSDTPLSWYVDVEQPPVGIVRQNDANKLWNIRTLILMQSAGMIRLGVDDRSSEGSGSRTWERWVSVEILDPGIAHDEESWRNAFSANRAMKLSQGREGLQGLLQIVECERNYSDVFSEIYAPPHGEVAAAVGFDPVTRRMRVADDSLPTVCPSITGWSSEETPQLFRDIPVRLFSYRESDVQRLEALTVTLVAKGVSDLELPRWIITPKFVREIRRRHPFPIVRPLGTAPCRTTSRQLRSDLPTFSLLILDETVSPAEADQVIRRRAEHLPNQIILIADTIAAPESPHQSLAQCRKAMSLQVLERAVF